MKKYGLAALLFMIFLPSAQATEELEDRKAIRRQAADLFMNEKFGELEQLAERYRSTQERTQSGLWKLTLFYSGLDDVADSSVKKDQYWESIESKALRWVNDYPKSPTPAIAYAMILLSHGWMHRGSGGSPQVKAEEWKPFYEYLGRARIYLLRHKDISRIDPRWYETMLIIARAEDWEPKRFGELVDEATALHPYFYQIYFAAIDFLLPKWHGNKEKIEAFANMAVDKTTVKEAMGMYARVYWYAAQAQYRGALFSESSVVWSKMKQGIDDVLQAYPDQWNINNFAHFACLAWDRNKTNELMGRIRGAPIPQAWDSTAQYRQCRVWAGSQPPVAGQVSSPSVPGSR